MHLPAAFHPSLPFLPRSKPPSTNRTNLTPSRSPDTLLPNRTPTILSAKKPDTNTEPDFIERAYSFFFGPKQAEPFGLKRFDRDRFPELYPATLDEFAPPNPTDSPEIALFRPLLARTQLTSRPIQLLYHANRDGWTADAFHSRCDRKGASVVLARTQRSLLGGYNPKGFVGYGESRGSKAAFLFCWPDGDVQKPAMKMRKVGGVALAVMDDPETGPKFGADSLVIPLRPPGAAWGESERDRVASSKLGSYYERRPDGGRSLFGEGENWKGEILLDLKVFAGVYEDGEEIPFSDALPFSLE
eukprot:GFKZ01013207.1.p1 GENE.GFKZ01013207.1~~GFKZ01013207.1.p1  ORF type:complete len:301 (+),score=38.75 GFKZ01013207.1:414-1316(+)